MSARLLPVPDERALAPAATATRRRWVALGLCLLAATASVAVLTRSRGSADAALPRDGSTVVVLDLSGSTRMPLRHAARGLISLTRGADRRLGLVVFSDTGYEALPIASPAAALRGWLSLLADGTPEDYPWTPVFSGGTVISSGLAIARRMLLQAPPGHRHVVLVSDLVDGVVDLPKLQSIVAAYQRDRIDLRVLKITPRSTGPSSNASFLQLPNAGFVAQAAVRTIDPGRLVPRRRESWAVIALVLVVAVLAAAYELVLEPLVWGRT